jgi:DNA repair exonuclease SbcCD ATPase subunit
VRITRLQLRDLGRHRSLDVTLAPGFTVIRGPNEAGKTTIQRGLELALFRKPTATAAELEILRSWGAGEEDRSVTRIEFVVDEERDQGGVLTRSGTMEKEFRGSRGTVSLEFDGQTYTDPARAEEVIGELTGIPNEAFFRSTASIRHHELEDLDRDEGALRDRLQASIGGGDRGSSRAKQRLEDAIRALKSRGEKNPGRLKIAEEAVARAEEALKNGEAMLEKLERDRDALAQARDARLRAEKELAESRNLLELARQAERLRTDRAVIEERYERYRQAADAQQRLQDLESMPERSMSGLREQLERMRTLQSRVSVMQEALQSDTSPKVEPDEPEPSFLTAGIETAIFVGLAVVTALAGIFTGLLLLLPVAIGQVGVAGYFGSQFWERRAVAMNVRKLNQSRERDRTVRRQARVGTEEGLRVAQSGVQNILRELGVPDVASAEKLLTGEQSRRQEIATLQVQVSALLAGQSAAQVQDLRDRAAAEIEQKSSAIDGLGPLATDARSRERLEAEVREHHAALERARDMEAAAAAHVDANPVDAEQVAGEAERLATWREQLGAMQRRVRIYEKTLSIIQQSESGTMRKATRFLEHQVGRDIARLTGGRYRRVTIDDQSLDVTVFAPERGDWVPAARLSQGTVDQLFLAARIGLVRLVTQGRRPPLILDDPFVTFDDARASRAAILLRELSSDFQVIYLTCSNRYDGLADRVVALPGPTDAEHAAKAAAAAARPEGPRTKPEQPPAGETEAGEPGEPSAQEPELEAAADAAGESEGQGDQPAEAEPTVEAEPTGEAEAAAVAAEGESGPAGADAEPAEPVAEAAGEAEAAETKGEQQDEPEPVDPDEFGERLVVVDDPTAEEGLEEQGDGEHDGFVWRDSEAESGDGATTPVGNEAEQES